ncbi:MAG: outer membrane beta-barrel protein [Bacteroidota bacterium]|nr:outer membrane beta-barrel protein [Bacteroidota bacterium]
MKKLFLLFLFIPFFLCGQKIEDKTNDYWKIGISPGIAITNMEIDSVDNSQVYLPFAAFSLNKKINNSFDIRLGASYSARGTNVNSQYYKYRYRYFDFRIVPQYNLGENIKLNFGLQPSFLSNAVLIKGTDASDRPELDEDDFKYEINMLAGFEFKLQKGAWLGAEYLYPLTNRKFQNIRISLNFIIDQNSLNENLTKNKEISYKQIKEMKNAVLVVRLKSSSNKIKALKEKGDFDMAKKVEQEQRKENLEILRTFKKHFDFCKVYFVSNKNTAEVKKNGFKNVFLNDSLVIDKNIIVKTNKIFVAEFGIIDQQEEGNPVISDAEIHALIIKNENFKQLHTPFPFYVNINDFIDERKVEEVIWLMNKNLHSYYKLAMNEDK